jgi:hypothetical protein
MKLYTDMNFVERSGVGSEATATIKATAKAFDILSTGLYTDPKLAIVRELSCNAYDSHVAAGKQDIPFEIHVPNSLEPWLSIRDFGTGLSHEDIMNLYLTYFDSTKTSSNDFIGALGLGSKSPFAYTEAFEVISRFNGMRRIYSVFKNEDGVPSRACLGEFHTDEMNGIEVKITVHKTDFQIFQDKIKQALRWFPVKPNIVGTSYFHWSDLPKINLSGENWKMFDGSFAYDYSKMTAVQGNVGYKVDISKLDLDEADCELLNKCHVVGFFSIGDLEVAASREEIRYDTRSKSTLVKRIKQIRAEILCSVEKKAVELEAVPFWDAVISLNMMAKEMFSYRQLFLSFVEASTHPILIRYFGCNGTLKLPNLIGHQMLSYGVSRSNGTSVTRSVINSSIDPDINFKFFFNDMKTGGIAKIQHLIKVNTSNSIYNQIIIIRRKDEIEKFIKSDEEGALPVRETWTTEQYDEEFEEIQEALGDVQIFFTSSDAPAAPRIKSKYTVLPLYRFDGHTTKQYGKSTVRWNRVEDVNVENGGLYFFIRNGSTIQTTTTNDTLCDVSWSASQVGSYLTQAVELINKHLKTSYKVDTDLYAVGAQAIKKIKKQQNWHNIFDCLKVLIEDYKTDHHYHKRAKSTSPVMSIRDTIYRDPNIAYSSDDRRQKLFNFVENLDDKSLFKQTLIPFFDDSDFYDKRGKTYLFMKKIDVDLGTKIFDNEHALGFYQNNAFVRYPMLTFIQDFRYLDSEQLRLMQQYIEIIDRS